MRIHLSKAICGSILCAGLAITPAQGAETRISPFSFACDGTTKTVIFTATALGASVNRFVQGATLAITDPRGGIRVLRLQAGASLQKILVLMGMDETTGQTNFTSSLFVTPTNAAGEVSFRVVGACDGGGTLKGNAVINFFS